MNLYHIKSLALIDDFKKNMSAKSLRKAAFVCKNCHLDRRDDPFS